MQDKLPPKRGSGVIAGGGAERDEPLWNYYCNLGRIASLLLNYLTHSRRAGHGGGGQVSERWAGASGLSGAPLPHPGAALQSAKDAAAPGLPPPRDIAAGGGRPLCPTQPRS